MKMPTTTLPSDPAFGQLLDQQLKTYHLPAPVSWWPPAPGWWLLALIASITLFALLWWWRTTARRRAAARLALRELHTLRTRLAMEPPELIPQLSRLLRRFVVARFAREQVAGLTGEDWLAFLDRHGGNGNFTQGIGRCLTLAPYRPQPQVNTIELLALVENWIKNNPGSEHD
jgi:hypothetical protein